jgi:hypothetical protein
LLSFSNFLLFSFFKLLPPFALYSKSFILLILSFLFQSSPLTFNVFSFFFLLLLFPIHFLSVLAFSYSPQFLWFYLLFIKYSQSFPISYFLPFAFLLTSICPFPPIKFFLFLSISLTFPLFTFKFPLTSFPLSISFALFHFLFTHSIYLSLSMPLISSFPLNFSVLLICLSIPSSFPQLSTFMPPPSLPNLIFSLLFTLPLLSEKLLISLISSIAYIANLVLYT